MQSYSKITIIGNMTRDPELRQTTSGISVVSFSLAVNEKRKDGTEHVDYVECVCYDKKAELVSRYVKKGDPLFVEGRLQSRKWTDKQGQTRVQWEVLVNEVVFISAGRENSSQGAHSGYGAPTNPTASVPSAYGGNSPAFEEVPDDSTLPF